MNLHEVAGVMLMTGPVSLYLLPQELGESEPRSRFLLFYRCSIIDVRGRSIGFGKYGVWDTGVEVSYLLTGRALST